MKLKIGIVLGVTMAWGVVLGVGQVSDLYVRSGTNAQNADETSDAGALSSRCESDAENSPVGSASGLRERVEGTSDPIRVLYFTKSSAFEHSVVKRRGGASWSEQVLSELGPRHGFTFTFSKDGSLFSAEYLAGFDVIMFYTTGDLLSTGTDGHPPMTAAGKAAFLEAVHNGKGFIGIHSATDTFHTGESIGTNTAQPRTWRYRHNREKADPYVRMIGAEFILHGVQQTAVARIVDPEFPGFAGLGPAIKLHEEWYSLTDFSENLHVLLALETDAMRDPKAAAGKTPANGYLPYVRPPFPVAWARLHGEGRVYYTALGHREDVWTNPVFQRMLVGAIEWTGRRLEADVAPNLAEATPGAYTLPPVPAAKKP